MTSSVLDAGIIGGGFIGLLSIFFPELLYKFANPFSDKKYNKKDAWKYRLAGFIIVIIDLAIYIYGNYF